MLVEARAAHAEIEQRRQQEAADQRRKKKQNARPVRASTSDPQARVMKMADGGFRPAYNVQIKTAAEGAHIVGLSVTNSGSDRGLAKPAVEEIEQRYGVVPKRMLADGGYDSRGDIEALHDRHIELFCPLPNNTKGDPAAARRDDGPGPPRGDNGWQSHKAKRSTGVASPPSGLMLICATMACNDCWCAAPIRSRRSCSGTCTPSTSCSSSGWGGHDGLIS